MKHRLYRRRAQAGFTLIELLVVVLIIGILAAIAVPQYFKVVEKGKFAEATAAFDSIRGAQERYMAGTGNYCLATLPTQTTPGTCTGFDLTVPTMKNFTIGTPSAGTTAPSWKLTLTRGTAASPPSAQYGAYGVTYDVEPGAPPTMTCSQSQCTTDLLPQ